MRYLDSKKQKGISRVIGWGRSGDGASWLRVECPLTDSDPYAVGLAVISAAYGNRGIVILGEGPGVSSRTARVCGRFHRSAICDRHRRQSSIGRRSSMGAEEQNPHTPRVSTGVRLIRGCGLTIQLRCPGLAPFVQAVKPLVFYSTNRTAVRAIILRIN